MRQGSQAGSDAPAGGEGAGQPAGPEPGARAVFELGAVRAGPLRPVVMAVVNRSADSFYASSATAAEAVAACARAAREGAGIVDIGGVRAGRGPAVSAAEEIDRVCPVVEAVAAELPDLVISVDTYRHEVAEAAARAGARLLNDTWAGHDPRVAQVAGAHGIGLVCSHTGGLEPRTDAHRNRYGLCAADLLDDVEEGLAGLVAAARAAGVAPGRILIDPTPDFGKNTYQSLEVMRALPRLCAGELPVLLAISRKDFIGEAAGVADPADRLPATIAATALAIDAGVAVIRTHDAAATVQAIDTVLAVRGIRPPRTAVRGLV
ncbi:dihydropteroate synthase [Brevibacterium sp. 5221]|uniref:Dihydropteroate synthase n=1 Tax=Brevibacterium rongguiense TaxID=2695267 RepID=A0A6N9HB54_9MICO|nr:MULTISPECIES: dihydropteroate synthase [Brevibacterium]MYM20802.1 dihydropteroate synthase [Brevibacterium rongguiense]WAL40478.1 dihydropteroate synthase [Brevibacterium sp. BRM-1]